MTQKKPVRGAWAPGVKKAVIKGLKKGESHLVSKREMWELINEGYPVEALKSVARGQEFLIKFTPRKRGKTMAGGKQKQRLWVELEVAVWVAGVRGPGRFGYTVVNARTGRAIESSLANYDTADKAVKAGLAYLRNTYNTGKPQKKR